ncbi:unnamed protein product [Diamesa hyperborea]
MNTLKSVAQLRGQTGFFLRSISSSQGCYANYKCDVLIVGGGSAGCSIGAKLSSKLGEGKVIILEPADKHYYQPLFTLIGGGMKQLKDSHKPMKEVLPVLAKWIKDKADVFNPYLNTVTTKCGDNIEYDFMIVATGLQLDYHKIPGLVNALEIDKGPVCSIYSPKYVNRTYEALNKFKGGNAIFTFPNSPVKCPGAPQKICYIAEEFFRKKNVRKNAKIIYNTSLPVLFGAKHYADALWKVVEERKIDVNLRTNLVAITDNGKQAIFENLDTNVQTKVDFNLLHVTPPMSTPDELKQCTDLVNDAGFVNVNKFTLRHLKHQNIFALGDCASTPNPKTAAAISVQTKVVYSNLMSIMEGGNPVANYDGYASCPLVTGNKSCILAEFDYDFQPMESFPIDQAKERRTMFYLKKDLMPALYWHVMLNGLWNGPGLLRNITNLIKAFKV